MSAALAGALGVLVLASHAALAEAEQPAGFRHSGLAAAPPQSLEPSQVFWRRSAGAPPREEAAAADPGAAPAHVAPLQRPSSTRGGSFQLGALVAMGAAMLFVIVLAFTGIIESCLGLLGRCPVPRSDDEHRAGQAAKGGNRRGRPSEAGSPKSSSTTGSACVAVPHGKRGWQPKPLFTGPLPEGECVFRLPVAALLRRNLPEASVGKTRSGRNERHLLEASGKLALRAATLGTEGWPLVIFSGTGQMPSATIGPALQDTKSGPRSLELRSSDGSHYGVLDPQEGAEMYVVSCGGRPVLSVEGAAGGRLTITSGEYVPLAEVRCTEGEPRGEPPEGEPREDAETEPGTCEGAADPELRIFEGTADPVLVIITVLSVLLYGGSHEADAKPRPTA